MKILIISAHPDDEVYGMGGTIAKLAKRGHEVHVLIVTDGSSAQYRNNPNLKGIIDAKKKETYKANEILGTTEVHFGELPDMRLDSIDHIEINQIIENIIFRVKPEVVYTHFYGDVNLDHRRVYESTLVACRPTMTQSVKEIYCYRVPSSTEWSPQISTSIFMPNIIVDISDVLEHKYKAISAYETEVREYPHPRSVEHVRKLDTVSGLKCGKGPSEELMLLRKLM